MKLWKTLPGRTYVGRSAPCYTLRVETPPKNNTENDPPRDINIEHSTPDVSIGPRAPLLIVDMANASVVYQYSNLTQRQRSVWLNELNGDHLSPGLVDPIFQSHHLVQLADVGGNDHDISLANMRNDVRRRIF